MTYSFIGLGKPIAAVNNLLKASIKNYRKDHPGQIPILTPGGIFASDLTNAAAFAGDNDMCVYMTIEELLKNSDLVFVFINDKALKLQLYEYMVMRFIEIIKMYNINTKICQ
mgnify:CR=1 FL=1